MDPLSGPWFGSEPSTMTPYLHSGYGPSTMTPYLYTPFRIWTLSVAPDLDQDPQTWPPIYTPFSIVYMDPLCGPWSGSGPSNMTPYLHPFQYIWTLSVAPDLDQDPQTWPPICTPFRIWTLSVAPDWIRTLKHDPLSAPLSVYGPSLAPNARLYVSGIFGHCFGWTDRLCSG